MWRLPPIDATQRQAPIASKINGVNNTSQRLIGGEWVDYPLMVFEVGGVEYKFFRHYDLFADVRIERFISEYWYNKNNNIVTPFRELIGWKNQCSKYYTMCYNEASKLAEKVKK